MQTLIVEPKVSTGIGLKASIQLEVLCSGTGVKPRAIEKAIVDVEKQASVYSQYPFHRYQGLAVMQEARKVGAELKAVAQYARSLKGV